MSKMYEKIKEYYNTGLWSEVRVRNMVVKGVITEEEYASIVGKEYEEQLLLFCSILAIKDKFYKGSCDFDCKALLCGKHPQNEIFIGILKLNNHDFQRVVLHCSLLLCLFLGDRENLGK